MSADVRVAVLIGDPSRVDDAEFVCRTLRQVAPYARLYAHSIDPSSDFEDEAAHRARGVADALRSDVVLFLAAPNETKNATLIALRERAGFTSRLMEPEFARVWFSANRRRSLYVLGAFPGAFGSLSLALELAWQGSALSLASGSGSR